MIKRGVNPEIVRRQMRHKNVSTTLRIYTQVRTDELEASLPSRPNIATEGSAKVYRNGLRIVG